MTAITTNLLVAITNGETGSTQKRAVTVQIEDESIGLLLADATLTGPEFADLICGSGVETDGHKFEFGRIINGDGTCARITVCGSDRRVICRLDLSGEQFAAILGNKVTRVAGTVYRRAE